MNRLSLSDINKKLDVIDREKLFLLAEKASASTGVSFSDVTVHPTATEARLKIKLTGPPRNTVIGSYGTRNGIGTNSGTHYTKVEGRFIFQPGGPTTQDIVVPLRGNNAVGNTIEVVISNTLYGAYRVNAGTIFRIRFSDAPVIADPEWNLVFEDDFVTNFRVSDSGRDANDIPCWSSNLDGKRRTQPANAELGLYVDPVLFPGTDPFPLVDGKRRLRSEQITNTWQGQTYNYTAAVLRSNTLTPILPGYKVETRFAMPLAGMRGAWPAMWFLNRAGGWPPEIDTMEWAIGASASPWVYNITQHWQDGTPKHRSYAVDIRDFGATEDLTHFHTYGTIFGDAELIYTFDGVPLVTQENQSPGKEWYVLLNIAMGGSWPGSPTPATVFPCDVILDRIKFYEPA